MPSDATPRREGGNSGDDRRNSLRSRRFLLPVVGLLVFALGGLAGWLIYQRTNRLPQPGEPAYADLVRAFYKGTVALQVVEPDRAESQLTRATQIAPREAAPFANLGLYYLRGLRGSPELDRAGENLQRAADLAPRDSRIAALQGLLEERRNRADEAIGHYRRAFDVDPNNLRAARALAQLIENQRGPTSDADARAIYERVLERQPNNLLALLERARLAARQGDQQALQDSVTRVSRLIGNTAGQSPLVAGALRALQEAAAGPNVRLAASRVAPLVNVLRPTPTFRASSAALEFPNQTPGEPLYTFVSVPPPPANPSAPDTGLAFAAEPLFPSRSGARFQAAGAVTLDSESATVAYGASAGEGFVLGAAAGTPATTRTTRHAAAAAPPALSAAAKSVAPPSTQGVLPLDYDYDYDSDLALAGSGGMRLVRNDGSGRFTDVTSQTRLPAAVLNAAYNGAFAADIESDGDLDIVLAPRAGAPVVARNNGDGTFAIVRPFAGATNGPGKLCTCRY
jgi:Tfp pilus assembly protein PilF